MESTTKDILRTEFRTKRNEVSELLRKEHTAKITNFLIDNAIFNSANNIALYWSHASEVATKTIIEHCIAQQKNCYLPIIAPDDSKLFFQQISVSNPTFAKKTRGILELPPNLSLQIPAEKLDLAIIPMLAFNKDNIRLGMGAGHYDKTFAFKKTKSQKKPIMVGLAYNMQYTDEISRDIWDIPLDYIITETGIKTCNIG